MEEKGRFLVEKEGCRPSCKLNVSDVKFSEIRIIILILILFFIKAFKQLHKLKVQKVP